MSFLFDKRSKQAMKWVWVFFSVIIILSMTLVFSGGSQGAFTAQPQVQQQPDMQIEETPLEASVEVGSNTEPIAVPITIPASPTGEAEVEFKFTP
jgi:hypothetical protein